jgi:hypothetical protein
MGDFLQYGVTPTDKVYAPVEVERTPRGQSSDGFLQLLLEERTQKEAEEAYWEDLAKENEFGTLNYLGKSIVNESMTANLFGLAEDFVEDFDPEFDPEPYINEDWPEWRKETVRDAKNPRHADILVQRTEEQDLYNKEGKYQGGLGMAINLAGAVINPENFVLGVAEVATLTKLGLTGGARIAAGAGIGALTNTVQEAAIIANDKSRDNLALYTAAGFGAAFGAAGGFFGRNIDEAQRFDTAIAKDLSSTWKHTMALATGDVQINSKVFKSPDAQAWDDAVQEGTAAIDPDSGKYSVLFGDRIAQYNTKAQAVAAARLRKKTAAAVEPTPEEITVQIDKDYIDETAEYERSIPRRKGGKWSSIGLEGRSHINPWVRKLHSLLTEDASGTGGKTVGTHSGALQASKDAHHLRSLWHVSRHESSKLWAKEQGRSRLKRWTPWDNSEMQRFDDQVIQEVAYRRNPAGRPKGQTAPESIKRAADDYQKFQSEVFNLKKNAGVKDYDTLDPDNLYIKHKWDGIAMTRVAKAKDEDFVLKLIERGILNGGEFARASKYAHLGAKLTDAYKQRTAKYMAKAIYRRFTQRPDTLNIARAGWLTKSDIQELTTRAKELLTRPEDIKHLLAAANPKDNRLLNELASQIDMDINVEIDGVAIRHLMDTNLGSSLDTEIRRASGKAAMARMGFEDQETFLEFVQKANRWTRENMNLDARELDMENEKNLKLWNLMMGENMESHANSRVANFARGIRKLATLGSLNQVGFAQFAEMGRLTGSITIGGMLRQIPEFGSIVRRMRDGTFKDPMLNDIEAAFGLRLGDNEILNHPSLLAEAGGLGITKAESQGIMAGLDAVMNKALHAQGYLNGMNLIMKAQHRMHARGFFDRMWRELNAEKLSTGRARRYADIGLSVEDLDAVKKNMDQHAELGTGWLGQNRPINLNLVRFEPGIREKLALAFYKSQSQAIQRNIGGETAWWMENTIGKLFSQFRTFPLVAIEKQSVHDLKHLDIEAFTVAMAGMGFAALAYTAKTYANSFGLPPRKRKQYLKNRLSNDKIFAGATSWAGQAAIFPDVMSTAGDFGLANPWMYTHQKGQAYRDSYRKRDLDLGTLGAAGDYVSKAYRVATGLGQVALTPAQMRSDIFKDAVTMAPFGNNLAVKIAGNYIFE